MIPRPPLTFSEEAFVIPTTDGKRIYGILNKSTKPNGKVVVLSHGMTGDPIEFIHVTSRNVFTSYGYDVLRFGYYNEADDARKLIDCTVKTHATDLNAICDHMRTLYQKVYVAGHSYGGLTALYANPNVDALAFWDSSYRIYDSFWKVLAKKLENTPYYTIGWGCDRVIGAEMIAFDRDESFEKLAALAAAIQTPSLVAMSEAEKDNPARKPLFGALKCTKKAVEIKGANHVFTNGHTVYDLLEATLEWFDAH